MIGRGAPLFFISKENTKIMNVFKSRFTPNLKNGKGVEFQIGETIDYKYLNGDTVQATIVSDYCQHDNGCYGYEATMSDDNTTCFIDEERIIGWKGKDEIL